MIDKSQANKLNEKLIKIRLKRDNCDPLNELQQFINRAHIIFDKKEQSQ